MSRLDEETLLPSMTMNVQDALQSLAPWPDKLQRLSKASPIKCKMLGFSSQLCFVSLQLFDKAFFYFSTPCDVY